MPCYRNELPMLFSTASYAYLRDEVLQYGLFREGFVQAHLFPDGERYQRITSDVSGRPVAVIGGTISDSDTLELYDMAYALQKYGAATLSIVIPYFGYSTMERAVHTGEVVTAKIRAHLLSSIPRTGGINIVLMDIHSEGIPHYFEAGIRPVHLYCKPVIMEAARELGGEAFVLAATDAGRAKWVESLANDMGVDAAFVTKRRLSGTHTEVSSVNADVAGRSIVIYDDMVRTGSSLIGAAEAYHKAGASDISVVTTHGLFPDNALERLRSSGFFRKIVCTNTHPRAVALACDFLEVKPVGKLIAETIATL